MANVKAIFRYVDEFCKKEFKKSRCLLTISVGQQTHEGERFRATMDLVNNSFNSCILLIDDSLQRHNMALYSTKEADYFYDVSIKEGRSWLKRNKKYYNRLKIPMRIMHWDTWLEHPDFLECKSKVIDLISKDEVYKEAFNHSIDEFLTKFRRRLPNPENFDIERAWRLCFDFVIEECSALCLWHELNCNFEVYPNKHNRAIEETRSRFILSKYPHLLKAITIGFRNAGQIQPQFFDSFSTTTV